MSKVVNFYDAIAGARTKLGYSGTDNLLAAQEYLLLTKFLLARAEFERVCHQIKAKTNIPEIETDMDYVVRAIDDHAPAEIDWSEWIEARWFL